MGGRKFKIVTDFSGVPLRLILVKKQEFEDKNYDLYTVCKVVEKEVNGVKSEEVIPLYNECFTPEQATKFYEQPSYYLTDIEDEEAI